MKLINAELVEKQTLEFLNWLEVKYPVADATVRFQEPALVAFGDIPVVFGMAGGSYMIISTLQRDARKLLVTIAHEYRHVMQDAAGGCREGKILQVGDRQIRMNYEEEQDAESFSEQVVREWEVHHG